MPQKTVDIQKHYMLVIILFDDYKKMNITVIWQKCVKIIYSRQVDICRYYKH